MHCSMWRIEMKDDDKKDDFESEEEKERFNSFFELYKRAKEIQSQTNEYHQWLMHELQENSYAIIPPKYLGGIKNYPVCIFFIKQFQPYPLSLVVLN